jgi:hypothetical protein
MGTLYDDDIVIWSETQAALLRRLAAGERVNDALDFENLIEEVESVGRSQFQGVASHLRVALTHLLLAHGAPGALRVPDWLIEVLAAIGGAERAYAPSMAQRIDLDAEWRTSRRLASKKLAALGATRPLPESCPFTIPELVAPEVEPEELLGRLSG